MVSTIDMVIAIFISVVLLIAADYVGRKKALREEEITFGKFELED